MFQVKGCLEALLEGAKYDMLPLVHKPPVKIIVQIMLTSLFDIKVLDELSNEAFDGETITKILINADKNK